MANLPVEAVSPVKPLIIFEPSEPVVFDVLLIDAETKEPLVTSGKRIWEESQKAVA
jgi:hypothetical protein